MRELANLRLCEDEAIQQYFIRAQELYTRLHHADQKVSETPLSGMVLTRFAKI